MDLNLNNIGENTMLPQQNPKFLVIGHARHGKDHVGELMGIHFGLGMESSSMHNCENSVFPVLKDKYGYKTAQECFDDRANHRKEWFDLISARNADDATTVAREMFAKCDIYVGLRSAREFHAIKNSGLVDFVIWVDASKRHPDEGADSFELKPWMADFVIDNNGTLDDLTLNVVQLLNFLSGRDIDVVSDKVMINSK